MQPVPQIRIFVASPGDVNEERAVALEVLDMLEYDPLFKRSGAGGVSIHAVAWDKPGSGTAMRVTMTPQTAIRQGLPRPSECDIVLVLFWGRMGTPLPHPEYQKPDGSPYLSGTEWEFWDAVNAERAHGRPVTLLYRRTEDPRIDMKDRKQVAQYHALLDFFDQFRDPASGALIGGVNEYKTPEALRLKLLVELRKTIDDILTHEGFSGSPGPATTATRALVEAPPLWTGSPFPGLRAFAEADAPIFFGRGQETSELVRRIEASRFTAVVAASGSGKSSLVAAGLIPRLKANAIVSGETGSKDWRFVRFSPGQGEKDGKSPFEVLFEALCEAFPEHALSPFLIEQEKAGFIDSITTKPAALASICDALLREANAPPWAEILFFVDQFEELFTQIPDERAAERAALVALLEAIHTSRRLRCVVTMRSDFYPDCLELPQLAALLKEATYPLAAPTAGALLEMIKRPAERAGLTWDDGLPERIQADTGSGAGALALMAYALDALYDTSQADSRLTFAAYQAIGKVDGAIGKQAETVFAKLTLPDKDRLLQRVFRELVTVDERGTATRQRAAWGRFDADELGLIRAFTDARLLVTDENTVEVAHEAIFRSWERLKTWIASAQEDLILLRQVRAAAHDWQTKREREPDKNFDYLRWPAERLTLVYAMIERLKPELNDVERDFIEPEQYRLYRELGYDVRLAEGGLVDVTPAAHIAATPHPRRYTIGSRLNDIGDIRRGIGVINGLPDVLWLPMEGSKGKYKFEFGEFEVKPFFIAKYLTTVSQLQTFLDSDWDNPDWWKDFPQDYQPQRFANVTNGSANAPRDTISWYQSVAFGRWMTEQFKGLELTHPSGQILRVGETAQIRLPTEWEWQWAAMNGTEEREYPWGKWDEHPRANTTEAGIQDRSTAVGMYPHGAAACGALDMAGNLWEWCLNDHNKPETIDRYSNRQIKVLRGGSFFNPQGNVAASYRSRDSPNDDLSAYGVRLVLGAPIASLTSGTLNSESE